MTGLLALAGLAPKVFAKSAASAVAPEQPPAAPFAIRPDARAVARSADSL